VCNVSSLAFGARSLERSEIAGRRVLEVGSLDVNGGLRSVLEHFGPAEYVGVDLVPGPGVDVVCRGEELAAAFGAESFDVVVATEVIEHVRDWRALVRNLKRVSRAGGRIVITTRSPGFPFHGYPHDYWRFTPDDFRTIFGDCDIEALEDDDTAPGVFLSAVKPDELVEADLSQVAIHSVVTNTAVRELDPADFRSPAYLVAVARWKAFAGARAVGRRVFSWHAA
jgi:SAM-dependent methyltransferase